MIASGSSHSPTSCLGRRARDAINLEHTAVGQQNKLQSSYIEVALRERAAAAAAALGATALRAPSQALRQRGSVGHHVGSKIAFRLALYALVDTTLLYSRVQACSADC